MTLSRGGFVEHTDLSNKTKGGQIQSNVCYKAAAKHLFNEPAFVNVRISQILNCHETKTAEDKDSSSFCRSVSYEEKKSFMALTPKRRCN